MTDLDRRSRTVTADSSFIKEWEAWHRAHDEVLAGPHGFLAITNIHWLDGIPRRFDDAPGAWWRDGEEVRAELSDGERLQMDGQDQQLQVNFGAIPERSSIFAYWDDNAVEVAKRGGYDLVRPRHPGNPLRAAFKGTPLFDPDPAWALPGRYVPFPEARPTTVGSVVEGLAHVYLAIGRVELEVGGEAFALTAFDGRRPGELTLLFTDATSGLTTYGACRSLTIGPPGEDGRVTVDFNRAVNLPCAYTDLATCPLPPAENGLTIAIEAGAMMPRERRDGAAPQTPRPPLPGTRGRAN